MSENECCVCYEETEQKTTCNHFLCVECYNKMVSIMRQKYFNPPDGDYRIDELLCPLCKKMLLFEYESEKEKQKYVKMLKNLLILRAREKFFYGAGYGKAETNMFKYIKKNCASKDYIRFFNKIVRIALSRDTEFLMFDKTLY